MSHYQNFEPPFPIPESWKWATVGEVSSSILYGVSESAKPNGKYKLLRITDIQDNNVIWDNVPFTNFDTSNAEQYILQNGDILFARTGATVGKSYLVREVPFNSIYASYLIRIRTSNEICPKYLKLFFEAGYYWQQISEGSVGIGQPNVNGTSLGQLLLPVPPKAEQIRIINRAESLTELISSIDVWTVNLSRSIEQTKNKILDLAMQGKLVPQNPNDEPAADMLRRINPKAKIITDNPHYPQLPENWVLTTIDSVCLYGNSKTIPVSDINAEDWILELEDMESYTGRLLQIKSKKERVISGSRHSFKSGDILFSRLRTYLNKVHLSTNGGFCSTEMIPITPFKCVVSEYLYYWLRSPLFIEYTISCGYGVKMPRLSTSDANKAIVPLPPLDEQKRIVETIQRFHDGLDRIYNALN